MGNTNGVSRDAPQEVNGSPLVGRTTEQVLAEFERCGNRYWENICVRGFAKSILWLRDSHCIMCTLSKVFYLPKHYELFAVSSSAKPEFP